jgi:predicted ABC-type ATPase
VPEILIIAGPNGAGKTTFASRYLEDWRHWEFVNADEIARTLAGSGLRQPQESIRAARTMLERIDALVDARVDFIFETTLATLSYAQKIAKWRRYGYVVSLIYLRLPSVETSIARVRGRVEAGGHGIPEESIHRRFGKSIGYLENIYKPIVDEWCVWDSLEGDFSLADAWDRP